MLPCGYFSYNLIEVTCFRSKGSYRQYPNYACLSFYYRLHPGEGNNFSLFVSSHPGGGGVPSPRFFPRSFHGVAPGQDWSTLWPGLGYSMARTWVPPSQSWGTPNQDCCIPVQDWGTPWPGLRYPLARTGYPPGQVKPQAVCLVWFPARGLSCLNEGREVKQSHFSTSCS